MTTRHEFLQHLHTLLQPKLYLEIGVQYGWSFRLSNAELSVGIDPILTPEALKLANHDKILWDRTSDDYFSDPYVGGGDHPKIDLAFIDGMHLAEFAWRDFLNIAKYCHEKSVVVFDDVLPTTQEMAHRTQCPGDWTGDVWKLYYHLREETNLVVSLVDTSPTGTMIVTGFDSDELESLEVFHVPRPGVNVAVQLQLHAPVPRAIIDRRHAWSAPAIIENLQDRGFGK